MGTKRQREGKMIESALTKEQRRLGLELLGAMAVIDGPLADLERETLRAIGGLLGTPPPEAPQGDVDWEALRGAFPEDEGRTLLLQGALLLAVADGAAGEAEIAFAQTVAQELGVTDPRMRTLRQFARGYHRLLRLELPLRSSMIWGKVRENREARGLMGILELLTFPFGLFRDDAQHARFQALADAPEGSLGRVYFEHMKAKGFSMPGGKNAIPEVLAAHDLSHILGGFDTDPIGECEVIAFICGYIRADPFWYLYMIVVHMHLDLEVFIGDPTARLAADPHRMARAFAMGRGVRRDLYDRWDIWADFPLPLEAVREKYGVAIAPLAPMG